MEVLFIDPFYLEGPDFWSFWVNTGFRWNLYIDFFSLKKCLNFYSLAITVYPMGFKYYFIRWKNNKFLNYKINKLDVCNRILVISVKYYTLTPIYIIFSACPSLSIIEDKITERFGNLVRKFGHFMKITAIRWYRCIPSF